MDFEKIIRGIVKYIRSEAMPTMNTWQKLLTETAIARVSMSADSAKIALLESPISRMLNLAPDGERIDVDGIIKDMRTAFVNVPMVEIDVPLIGKYKFVSADLDKLHRYITEG